ncbi:MAG: 2-isopropylmalate synthase [Alphaproteobacteria bacterium]|jgi:2-isopropylmalate synthase
MKKLYFYDTTLRDGAQTKGVDFSIQDKIHFCHKLDSLNIDYIEAGWPGANPNDTVFFKNLPTLKHSKIVAFGMMTKKNTHNQPDDLFKTVINSHANVICLVGKTYDYHVTLALNMSLDENLHNLAFSFNEAQKTNKEILFDAEHFFDGFKANQEYSLKCLEVAQKSGIKTIILCDTNGGSMPQEIANITQQVITHFPDLIIGIHCHNDCELAVANSLSAIQAGATHIQGTINGLGERCGNTNLCSVIATILLKKPFCDLFTVSINHTHLKNLSEVSHNLTDMLNQPLALNLPYVGQNAFAHKGGLHVSAVIKDPATYEHIEPELVGNKRIIPVSTQSGRSNIIMRLKEFPCDFELSSQQIQEVLEAIKHAETQGYGFDSAGASFYILVLRVIDKLPQYFVINEFRATSNGHTAEAIVKMTINAHNIMNIAEGQGPVDALYNALVKDLGIYHDIIKNIHLEDFKVRIIGSSTAAKTRVLIDFKDHNQHRWSTVGVSHDIVNASFEAILEAIFYYLKISNIKS